MKPYLIKTCKTLTERTHSHPSAILPRAISSKKEMKMKKKTFFDEKQQKMPRKYIVGALTSFHFNFFLEKRFDMLNQCLLLSITEKVISYSLVLRQQPLIALQIQKFH